MTAPVDYEWLPAVPAAGLQVGDRVVEFADFVTSVEPGRRPDVMDVTFEQSAGVFHLHVTELFTVTRPAAVEPTAPVLPRLSGPDDEAQRDPWDD